MKYLITNADDCGWGEDITRGIIDSHIKGILSSASVIVNEIDDKSIDLIKSTSSLGLGVHLNIATGEALTTEWKNKYGKFSHPVRKSIETPYSQKMWEEHYSVFDEDLIYSEFEAQLKQFIVLLDRKPDHLDTHYNSYSVINVFQALVKLAQKYNLAVRQPVGYRSVNPNENFSTITSELVHKDDFLQLLTKNHVLTTSYFSLEYMNLHKDYIKAILKEIEKISDEESIEISFHPGYREEWRRVQVSILTDPMLQKVLDEHNVKVINYSQLHEVTKY